jgi:hypothetical protein
MTVSRELSRYRLDLVGVQQVRWEGSGTVLAGEYTFFYGKGTSKEVDLEVNVEKTKYMLVSRDQNAGQTREIKIGNRSFENVSVQVFGNDRNRSKFDSVGN